MASSDRRTATTILIAVGVVVLAVGAFYANAYFSTRDPVVAQFCDCPIMRQWTASLPLSPEGHHLDPNQVEVNEGLHGYEFGGKSSGVVIDRQALIDAFVSAEINHEVVADRPGLWAVRFNTGPTPTAGPWSLRVGVGATEVGVKMSVGHVDAPQGAETMEELNDLYQEDAETALAASEQRQRQAIDNLEPVRAALETMVEEG